MKFHKSYLDERNFPRSWVSASINKIAWFHLAEGVQHPSYQSITGSAGNHIGITLFNNIEKVMVHYFRSYVGAGIKWNFCTCQSITWNFSKSPSSYLSPSTDTDSTTVSTVKLESGVRSWQSLWLFLKKSHCRQTKEPIVMS